MFSSPFLAMRKLFPLDTYVHQKQGEIRAECFAEFLTRPAIKRGIERECEAILNRVRLCNPGAAKLVEQYRRAVLERTRRMERSANNVLTST